MTIAAHWTDGTYYARRRAQPTSLPACVRCGRPNDSAYKQCETCRANNRRGNAAYRARLKLTGRGVPPKAAILVAGQALHDVLLEMWGDVLTGERYQRAVAAVEGWEKVTKGEWG